MGEADGHARVRAAERTHERRHRIDGERREGDEVEVTGDYTADRVRPRPAACRGPAASRAAGTNASPAAVRAMRRPMRANSVDTELALEGAHRLGERGLGDEAGFRRGGEGAVVDDSEGVAQLLHLHRRIYGIGKIGLGRTAGPVVPWRCALGRHRRSSVPLVGYLGGMFGKGGSAIATPLLAAIGVPPIVAVASPLPATVPGTLVAYRRYRHLGLSDPL